MNSAKPGDAFPVGAYRPCGSDRPVAIIRLKVTQKHTTHVTLNVWPSNSAEAAPEPVTIPRFASSN